MRWFFQCSHVKFTKYRYFLMSRKTAVKRANNKTASSIWHCYVGFDEYSSFHVLLRAPFSKRRFTTQILQFSAAPALMSSKANGQPHWQSKRLLFPPKASSQFLVRRMALTHKSRRHGLIILQRPSMNLGFGLNVGCRTSEYNWSLNCRIVYFFSLISFIPMHHFSEKLK
jgi:hypothetical protein